MSRLLRSHICLWRLFFWWWIDRYIF